MKRYAKYLIGLAVIAVVAVLVMVNRNSVQEDIDRASAKQLSVVLDGVEQIYEYSEDDPAYVEFDAQMRKKNGDVYDNHYAGIPLSTILESMGAAIQEDSAVTVTCADQYEIQLTGAEILAEGNVYLVTKENGEPLPEESRQLHAGDHPGRVLHSLGQECGEGELRCVTASRRCRADGSGRSTGAPWPGSGRPPCCGRWQAAGSVRNCWTPRSGRRR